jgi:ABC-type multidrug transport system fused ATPase/permease subunit
MFGFSLFPPHQTLNRWATSLQEWMKMTEKVHCPNCGELTAPIREVRTSRKTGKTLNWFVNLVIGGLLLAYSGFNIVGLILMLVTNDTLGMRVFIVQIPIYLIPGSLLFFTYVSGINSPLFRCKKCRNKWTQHGEEFRQQKSAAEEKELAQKLLRTERESRSKIKTATKESDATAWETWNNKAKLGVNKPHIDIFMRILLGICYLFILSALVFYEYKIIEGIKAAIATHNFSLYDVVWVIFSQLLSLPFICILIWPIPPLNHRSPRMKILVSIGMVAMFVSISFIVLNKSVRRLPEFDEKYWSVMQDACNGIGFEEAATYNPSASIHKVASTIQYLLLMPYEWVPDSLTNTELVLCVGDKKAILIGSCEYSPSGTFSRYQNQRNVSLVVVHTGEVIAQKIFYGSNPASCPYQISQSGSNTGSDVTEKDILDWMRPLIERK